MYQGVLGNVDPRLIRGLERVAVGDTRPDVTCILDVPPELGLKRATRRRGGDAADRFEAETVEFHARLRDAYWALVVRRQVLERALVHPVRIDEHQVVARHFRVEVLEIGAVARGAGVGVGRAIVVGQAARGRGREFALGRSATASCERPPCSSA